MATELVERDVDGKKYQFELFGAKLSLRTLMKLSKLVGKPFILCMGAFKGKDKPLDVQVLSEAAALLFQSADEKETLDLIETLTSGKVLCNGVQITSFDRHYEGDLTHLFKVLNAALEVQYGNFFVALSEFLSSGKPVGSLIPVTSTSTST